MSHHPRRILTPGQSRKRKEMEAVYAGKPSAPLFTAATTTTPAKEVDPPAASNKLLAGYLAHEFLTKGTLFGQKFDPTGAQAVPVSNGSEESKRGKSQIEEAEPSGRAKPQQQPQQSYGEVARLLKEEGAHVPGILNPTQLARWIQR
ncbi:hypothetical protein U1Q18_043411 [Sarracenia purpurea var. burkii]